MKPLVKEELDNALDQLIISMKRYIKAADNANYGTSDILDDIYYILEAATSGDIKLKR